MFNNFIECNPSYQNCSVVEEAANGHGSLLLGDFNSATDQQKIKYYNIRTIITAASGMQHLQIPQNIQHFTYPLLDSNSENILRFFNESTTIIQNCLRTGSVLVHCAAGISRSATLVIAYFMKTRKITFKEAISFVRNTRNNVRPNLGFQRQLKLYEKQICPRSQKYIINKKNINAQLTQERKTTYNSIRSSQLGRIFNDYLKRSNEPKSAQFGMRRKFDGHTSRTRFPNSQSKRRDKKKSYVTPLSKQGFFVYGQSHKIKQPLNTPKQYIGFSEQIIKPPLIQNHHRNAINPNWIKYYLRKYY